MSKIAIGARAGVGLAALCWGCAGEPESPVKRAPAVASESAPAPAEAKPEATPAERKRAADILDAMFPERPQSPDLPDPDSVPGDGANFPLAVEVRSARTGKPLPGMLTAGWFFQTRHPKHPKGASPSKWSHSKDGMRVDFPSFPPSRWRFGRSDPGTLRIDFEASIWVSPASGELVVEFDDFDVQGRVVAHDGRGLPARIVSVSSQRVEPKVNEPGVVHFVSITGKVTTGPDGRFVLKGLHRGRYWVSWKSAAKSADGGEYSINRSVITTLEAGRSLELGPEGASR